MILRIRKNKRDIEGKAYTEDYFFDAFDEISYQVEQLQKIDHYTRSYPSSYFTEEKTERVLVLYLMNGLEVTRYLVVDLSYAVYLMSNEGKTIERLI